MLRAFVIIWIGATFHLSASAVTVNVMVAISNQALGCIGGTPGTVAAIQVARATQAVIAGQGSTSFNYVGYTTMSEGSGNPLTWLRNDLNVINARNGLNADVVMAIISGTAAAATNSPARAAHEAVAYTGCTRLVELAFQHELGHLLGAHHQADGANDNNEPQYKPFNGFYYYSPSATVTVCYRTIMAYPPNQFACPQKSGLESTQLLAFSNLVSGIPYLGDSNHKNIVSIDLNAPIVAQFRNTKFLSIITRTLIMMNLFITDEPHPP